MNWVAFVPLVCLCPGRNVSVCYNLNSIWSELISEAALCRVVCGETWELGGRAPFQPPSCWGTACSEARCWGPTAAESAEIPKRHMLFLCSNCAVTEVWSCCFLLLPINAGRASPGALTGLKGAAESRQSQPSCSWLL